ncbi:hypothetical protein J7J84_06780 [bacterium]|nr:hypothetical protein [bacterium]
MRAKQLDPAVWVIVALVGVAVFSALMALATRSCVQAMKEGFESASTGVSSYEETRWATDAAELEPDEFAAFMEKAQAIDLGIGVHLGTDMEQVKAVLGAADTTGRAKGGYEYTYLFFASAGGPSPKQRHRGGFFAVVNSATLTVTATDEKVAGITFFASPLSSGDAARWAFLTLDGKPLMQCTKDDLTALLGEPTDATKYNVTWRFIPASPADAKPPLVKTGATGPVDDMPDSTTPAIGSPAQASKGILVEMLIDPDTGLLYSLEILQR